ncbi:MAG: hypothetical protein RLZZ515_2234 [Cyanobacteriota bacterium]
MFTHKLRTNYLFSLATSAEGALRWPEQPFGALVNSCTAPIRPLRILLVDDEALLLSLLQEELVAEGYDVGVANDGATAWLVLMGEPAPELVVLDWNLPDTSGPELCQRMRSKGITLPVLMLTGRDEVRDRVAALDAGVDDYLIKPFSIDELLARIRALQRRLAPAAPPDALLQLADLQVNLTSHTVRRGESSLKLSPKEYALLVHLLQAGGSAQPPCEVLTAVWGEAFAQETALLDVYADSLAQKVDGQRADPLIHRHTDGSLELRAECEANDG